MATDEISSDVEILMWLPEFGSPTTVDIDYDDIVGGKLRDEARELLRVSSAQRARMTESLSYDDVKVDPRNVVSAVDAYLPSVWRITASMEASQDANIKLRKKLEFTWTSQLSKKKKEWKFGVLVFEIAYVLIVRSLAHMDTAKQIILTSKKSPSGIKFSEATTELRLGSGIQDYVSKELLPRWMNPPEKRPHEVLAPVVSTLSLMLQADAQRLAIAKAIMGKSPPSMIAKLLIGCVSKYDMAIRILRTLPKDDFESINDCIRDELGTFPALLRAQISKYLGIAAHDKEKYGTSVAFLADASRRINEAILGATIEPTLATAFMAERTAINKLYEQYTEENSKVYFDAVPSASSLEVPDGAFIVKPIDYAMPDAQLVSFAEYTPLPDSATGVKPEAIKKGESTKAMELSSEPKVEKLSSVRSFFQRPADKKAAAAAAKSAVESAPPGIDPDAFAALPEEIQQEILAQFKSEATSV